MNADVLSSVLPRFLPGFLASWDGSRQLVIVNLIVKCRLPAAGTLGSPGGALWGGRVAMGWGPALCHAHSVIAAAAADQNFCRVWDHPAPVLGHHPRILTVWGPAMHARCWSQPDQFEDFQIHQYFVSLYNPRLQCSQDDGLRQWGCLHISCTDWQRLEYGARRIMAILGSFSSGTLASRYETSCIRMSHALLVGSRPAEGASGMHVL